MAPIGHALDEMAETLDSSWQALKAERERAESEAQRLRGVLESMPAAVIVGEGRPKEKTIHLVMANRAWAELQGASDLTSGATPSSFELLHPDGTPLEQGELPLQRAVWLGEATQAQELILQLPDGSQRVLLVNAVPFPETDGTRQAVSMMLDITGRRLVEEELKRLAAAASQSRRMERPMQSLSLWNPVSTAEGYEGVAPNHAADVRRTTYCHSGGCHGKASEAADRGGRAGRGSGTPRTA